jgi:hypothetical protein
LKRYPAPSIDETRDQGENGMENKDPIKAPGEENAKQPSPGKAGEKAGAEQLNEEELDKVAGGLMSGRESALRLRGPVPFTTA